MIVETTLIALATALLGLASVVLVARLLGQGRRFAGMAPWVVFAGAVCLAGHLVASALRIRAFPALGISGAVASYALLTLLVHLRESTAKRTQGLSAIAVPYVTLFCLVAMLAPPTEATAAAANPWLAFHIITAFIGYALFTLAGVLALGYLVQDRNLKQKRFGDLFELFPSLETLDQLMTRRIGTAFVMLTVSIVLGIVLVRQSGGGMEWLADPKTASTFATWAFYAILVHARTRADQHGRKIAVFTVIGVALVLFAFVGVHLLSSSMHGFAGILTP